MYKWRSYCSFNFCSCWFNNRGYLFKLLHLHFLIFCRRRNIQYYSKWSIYPCSLCKCKRMFCCCSGYWFNIKQVF